MATSVEMPELGESVTEGTITTWLKEVGDTVEVDEPLLEVSTDKVDTEIPSPVAGVLIKVLAEEDDTVEVGDIICEIGEEGEEPAEKDDAPTEEPEEEEEPAKEEKKEEPADKPAPKASGSASDVTMPELGESVTEGTITTWLKEVGDEVEVDEPLLEVSTDKVDTEIPSPVAGTLVEILANEDDTVEVGDVIARIGDADAAPAEKEEEPAQEEKKEEPAQEEKKEEPAESKPAEKKEESKPAAASSSEDDHVPYVTPLVRKLAKKHNIDLNTVEGTGVGGRVRKQDILAIVNGEGSTDSAAAPATAEQRTSTKSVDPDKAALRGTTKKVNRIRAITAAKTLEALQTAAQLTPVSYTHLTLPTNREV